MLKYIISCIILFAALAASAAEPHWQELPTSETFFSLLDTDKRLDELQTHLNSYHEIRTDKLKEINSRIKMLDKIILESDKLLLINFDSKYTNMSISKLHKIASNKKIYLQEIYKLYGYFNDDFDSVAYLFSTDYYPRPTMSLELKNISFFSPHLESDIGVFWLEILDPCHRTLTAHWNRWKELRIKTPFFLWLEGEAVDRNISRINIIPPDELVKLKVQVKNGRLYVGASAEKQVVNPSNVDKEYLFVIDTNNDLLICEAKDKNKHVSLSGGKPVLSAGNIWLKDGAVTKIFFKSGHYLPGVENYRFTYNFLKIHGVNFKQLRSIDYYLGTTIVMQNVNEFNIFIKNIA